MAAPLDDLFQEIKNCHLCQNYLPYPPRPIIKGKASATLLIIGQAPGIKVQQSGIPWDDASGNRLRSWLDLSKDDFYNENKIAIVPMGFCYPGKSKTGDLPPRKECAPQWHQKVKSLLPNIQLTLLIGKYAQDYYLPAKKENLTETVKNYQLFLPEYFPLPHPSPRNQLWLKKNPWFENNLFTLKKITHTILK